MSYCRWSSDGWKSDVYVYAHVGGGWATHVANNKRVHKDPCPVVDWAGILKLEKGEQPAALEAQDATYRAWLEETDLVPIGLESDGKSFYDNTAAECAQTLLDLRAEGYHVPQHAIDDLLSEEPE